MKYQEILFGTSNNHKIQEAVGVFKNTTFKIIHYPVDLLELQDISLEKIATYSLMQLPELKKPIFVEDSGLFIESLKGFPGPYAAQTFNTLGNKGIITLMKDITNRKAYFESCVSYRDGKGNIFTFLGKCKGTISNEIRGELWGFDPIFIPYNIEFNPLQKTFSELGEELKNKFSHRADSLEKLKNHLISNWDLI